MSRAAVIREATADDADAIGRVHAAAWQWAYRGLMPDEPSASRDEDAEPDVGEVTCLYLDEDHVGGGAGVS